MYIKFHIISFFFFQCIVVTLFYKCNILHASGQVSYKTNIAIIRQVPLRSLASEGYVSWS